MKVRQTTVCHTCRSFKLACDGKVPQCSQCVHTGRECAGYKHDLIFVSHNSAARGTPEPLRRPQSKSRVPKKIHSSSRGDPLISGNPMPVSIFTWDLLIHVLAAEYAPGPWLFTSPQLTDSPRDCICGSWPDVLRILPRSTTHAPVVTAALTALGATILSRGGQGRLPDHQRLTIHISAIRLLARGLSMVGKSFSSELGVSIMCLTMAEALAPNCSDAWKMHAQGASELLRLWSPESLTTGVDHTVFLACRSLAIYHSILNDKSTFLSSESWRTKPFAIHPPSEMHQLLGIAAPVGTLLERLDALTVTSTLADTDDFRALREAFGAALAALDDWSKAFLLRHKHVGPLHWHQQRSSPSAAPSEQPPSTTTAEETEEQTKPSDNSADRLPTIWFPTILTATVLANQWSFRVIMLTSLLRLDSLIRTSSPPTTKASEGTTTTAPTPGKTATATTKDLRRTIIRAATLAAGAVPYHTQPGTGFYGLAAAVLPLKAAWEAFLLLASTSHGGRRGVNEDDDENEEAEIIGRGLAACEAAMRELEGRGYPFRTFWWNSAEGVVSGV